MPYMEDKLSELCEHHLLRQVGKRYSTNIVIMTNDLFREISVKTAALCGRIEDVLMETVSAREAAVRQIGFYGADMGGNSFAWQMVCVMLQKAVIETLQGRAAHFSENDLAVAAELIRRGYVLSKGNDRLVNAPGFTQAQHRRLTELLAGSAERIADEAEVLMDTITDVLKNHIPAHLQQSARGTCACLRTRSPRRSPACATGNSCRFIAARTFCRQPM